MNSFIKGIACMCLAGAVAFGFSACGGDKKTAGDTEEYYAKVMNIAESSLSKDTTIVLNASMVDKMSKTPTTIDADGKFCISKAQNKVYAVMNNKETMIIPGVQGAKGTTKITEAINEMWMQPGAGDEKNMLISYGKETVKSTGVEDEVSYSRSAKSLDYLQHTLDQGLANMISGVADKDVEIPTSFENAKLALNEIATGIKELLGIKVDINIEDDCYEQKGVYNFCINANVTVSMPKTPQAYGVEAETTPGASENTEETTPEVVYEEKAKANAEVVVQFNDKSFVGANANIKLLTLDAESKAETPQMKESYNIIANVEVANDFQGVALPTTEFSKVALDSLMDSPNYNLYINGVESNGIVSLGAGELSLSGTIEESVLANLNSLFTESNLEYKFYKDKAMQTEWTNEDLFKSYSQDVYISVKPNAESVLVVKVLNDGSIQLYNSNSSSVMVGPFDTVNNTYTLDGEVIESGELTLELGKTYVLVEKSKPVVPEANAQI